MSMTLAEKNRGQPRRIEKSEAGRLLMVIAV
jgi:hypothetical protein